MWRGAPDAEGSCPGGVSSKLGGTILGTLDMPLLWSLMGTFLGNGSPGGVSTTLVTTLLGSLGMMVLWSLLETLPRTLEVRVVATLGA